MRKKLLSIITLATALTVLLCACSGGGPSQSVSPSQTEDLPSPSPTAIPTAPPDYSIMDFSGNWVVSGLLLADGTPMSEEELNNKGADFILELHENWDYFVYDAQGSILGQGRYYINADKLVLSAGGNETVYRIIDGQTLQSTASDGSVTIMSKQAEPEDTEDEIEPDESDISEGEDEGDTSELP